MADRRRSARSRSRSRSTSKERERTSKNAKERDFGREIVKEMKSGIDREKTCPLLLRVFCNQGRHHRVDEYTRSSLPSNELQVYTWKDATLKELMGLVKEVNPDSRRKGNRV